MKFLCVSCDEPMKLAEARPPERGSLTVVYRCPHCSHEIAMLTNPYETQVVGSLGVEIGGDRGDTLSGSPELFSWQPMRRIAEEICRRVAEPAAHRVQENLNEERT